MLFLVFALGCSSRPPCEEPVEDAPEGIVSIPLRVPENMKLVHYVSFEMGPVQETLTGYMIVRAPDALRLYGMSETGQKAFDVALLRGKVTRLYRAPFLKDDRVLDLIVEAARKIVLLPMPPHGGLSSKGDGRWHVYPRREHGGYVYQESGVTYFWGGRDVDLRWLKGDKFSACFMDWSSENGVYAPRRIHFRSEEGPYPYELRMKLIDSKVLAAPPPDSTFEDNK